MPEVERSAPSVEEAVEAALDELGVTEQDAVIEVLQEPGEGSDPTARPAVVRVRTQVAGEDTSVASRDANAEAAATGDADEQADVAADFVEDLLDRMGVAAEVEITDVDGVTYVDVWGEDEEDGIGALIGRRGATLDGIQELVRGVVQQQLGERCHVVVDVEDYRKRRRNQVVRAARDAAAKVRRSGGEVALEPMSAFERKLVHDAVAALGGLETASQGDEPNRRVVVRLAQ